MTNIKTIKCSDHHHFTEYITNVIVESPRPRRTPVDNGTDIYTDDIVISIRSPLHYHIITLTDCENTKIILSPPYTNSGRLNDKVIAEYREPQFNAKLSFVEKYKNPNKLFTAKITADMDNFMEYMERALRFMESKSAIVLDYSKDDLHILTRQYDAIPGYNYLITYIQKSGNPYFEITVVETNGTPKQLKETDKTPTKVKMEELINNYYQSKNL